MLSIFSAFSFAILTAAVAVFQVALAFGAPWGELTLGGKYPGQLPRFVRIIPIVSGALLTGFVVIVFARAGLAFADIKAVSHGLIWVVVGYCVVGALANLVTPSHRERALWFPIVVLMLGSSTIVGMS